MRREEVERKLCNKTVFISKRNLYIEHNQKLTIRRTISEDRQSGRTPMVLSCYG